MALDVTMDDMDIDMGEDPEIARLQAEAAALDAVWTIDRRSVGVLD